MSEKLSLVASGLSKLMTDVSLVAAGITTLELIPPLFGCYSPLVNMFGVTEDLSLTRYGMRQILSRR